MSSRLVLSIVVASLLAFRYDPAEATREESQRFENRHFREIPVYPFLRFGVVDNSGNDSRFKNEIGWDRALSLLENATYYVQSMFGPDGFGRGYAYVELTIENFGGSEAATAIAATNGTKIRVNSMYVENFVGDVKDEFAGVMFHECATMWLQSRNGFVPSWILTGIADLVRLKGGWPSRSWPKRGSSTSTKWSGGYAITAYFLEYCCNIKKDFVAELNSMMNKGYRDEYFAQLLGKDVGELWKDYKSLYGAPAPTLLH